MKSGEIWVHCWGWPWQISEPIRAVATAGEPCVILRFLSSKQCMISSISCQPNFTKFKHNMSIAAAMKTSGTEFWKIYRKGVVFFQKIQKILKNILRLATSGRHNSAVIRDRRKFTTKTVAGFLVSIFIVVIQFKVIPLASTLRTRHLPKFYATSDEG